MSGKKSGFWLVAIFLGFSALLSACGDATPTTSTAPTSSNNNVAAQTTQAASTTGAATETGLPAISGATNVALPDVLKTQLNAYSSTIKNSQFAAFKVADASAKAETSVVDSYKKAGWEDKSASMAAATSQLSSMGVFVKIYQKGTQTAMVFGYPGSMAASMGSNVGQSDTLVLVVSGQA